ncbi:unnamed protein product [Clonostachys chloroleuca]|uniref:Beige protein homolog 1 n=1 Tax=Clonostachys chloroleuca TaxID=1926264 RepID=A0AA35Q2T7_9HYPO|nr:unnamed protein product [Clonostachys chloroleuca]
MSALPRRYRSSTSASNSTPTKSKSLEVLTALLDGVDPAAGPRCGDGYPDASKLVKGLRQIAQHVGVASNSSHQDDFRHARGFERILDVLRAFSGFYDPKKRSDVDMLLLFTLLGECLTVLSAALRDHAGNRRFFRFKVEGGGWESLEQTIASIGLGGAEPDPWISCHVFGKLLAFALDDEGPDLLCTSIAKTLHSSQDDPLDDSTGEIKDNSKYAEADIGGDEQWDLVLAKSIENIGPNVREIIDAKTFVRHPEILRVVVSFWSAIPRTVETPPTAASLIVLEIIYYLMLDSVRNCAAIHSTRVLSQFLRAVFQTDSNLGQLERQRVLDICKQLMYLGVNEPADTQFLLSTPGADVSDFCLEMTSKYSGPPFFQFDLSLHGYSSLELATMGRSFPPQSTAGYTFTAWIRVDNYDPSSHTTIFGVYDATQTCFLLMYLEKDTHNFILQTSVVSSKPSVRFKTVSFQTKLWYHIALVHRRPKTMVSSKASLYVNGEFVEQARCNYPSVPPLSNTKNESFASFNSSQNQTNPVQAFLGTPRALSAKIGRGKVYSKLSLASAHLFEDVLSDDYLAVHFGLGPRYQGNFQDSLGGFQTYQASAALGLRNEFMNPGHNDSSDILRAIREKASNILPENKILLSVTPTATFPENVHYLYNGLLRSLPRPALRSLHRISSQEGGPLAVNSAVASISDALFRTHGIASFRGSPIVSVPSYIDEDLWRLAGFTPLALKLLERASTVDETIRALEIMFYSIRQNWRNSEAMERENGYGVLSMLLRFKLGYAGAAANDGPVSRLFISNADKDSLTFRILSLILGFVGYIHGSPVESFIVNPLAYRILLIDLDIWRRSAPRIQELYYRQFVTFAVQSKHHAFNSRRLVRMRIVKRLLDAVKGEPISEETVSHYMAAFEVLVKSNLNQEVMRSLSLFITYAFHSPPMSLSRTPRPLSAVSRPGTPLVRRQTVDLASTSPTPAAKYIAKKKLGKRILAMYSGILCEKGNQNYIKKFARTVTNKWLLYLLAEDDIEIVAHGCKILARLLVAHGSGYTAKFAGKSGGFTIMASCLKRYWDVQTLWPICLSIFFGIDVAEIDFTRKYDISTLTDMFGKRKVVFPDALPIITSMLHHGFKEIVRFQEDPDSPITKLSPAPRENQGDGGLDSAKRAYSMDLDDVAQSRAKFRQEGERVLDHSFVLETIIKFFVNLHKDSPEFRDFALSSEWVRLHLSAVYPVIVSANAVTPEVELNSGNSALNFDGSDVIIRPLFGGSAPTPIVRTSSVNLAPSPQSTPPKGTPLRRASSFVLLTAQKSQQSLPDERLVLAPPSTQGQKPGVLLDGLLSLVTRVFMDQIVARKEFAGFGLFTKVPPGFQEHHAYFESFILRKMIHEVSKYIQANQKTICEPRFLTNLGRFCVHLSEAIFEGWFLNGAESMIDFIGMLLEFFERPDVASLKSVRLCHQALSSVKSCFLRIILLKLSDLDSTKVTEQEAKKFIDKMAYWQMSILNCLTTEDDYPKLFWYQLYSRLVDDKRSVRIGATNFMRVILVQKPEESHALIRSCMLPDQKKLTDDFQKLTERDDETFLLWVDRNRLSLDILFLTTMARTWEDFVAAENQKTTETAKSRVSKRKDKLKQWHQENLTNDKILFNHEVGNSAWMKSIYSSEHFKYQRLAQDQQDDLAFIIPAWKKMERDLRRPGAVFSDPTATVRWKLDRTEGRSRMRLRLLPDYSSNEVKYQPKGQGSNVPQLHVNTAVNSLDGSGSDPSSPKKKSSAGLPDHDAASTSADQEQNESGINQEDDFELVDDPNEPIEGDDGFEDKNRKVMRRLEHGDQVQAAYNISRITGLEACEGILIIGKDALYIMDNVFQCANGDIVNVWQAPPEERDPFTQVVTGAKTMEKRQNAGNREQESRHWKWHDVISISKRRFLFRDVAIEVFFTDGRSYLLTQINPSARDELFLKMLNKAPHTSTVSALPNPEDAWRLEMLKVVDEQPQGLGSRLGTLFNSTPWTPIMKSWQKGEVSNFHYLMMVNTLAGRTFNDLTQYPVFPWIIADYTSDELDLQNPATFRDLSKPMGAQSQERVQQFMETYSALQGIDQEPFHYGTHYSSAMIVSSYLIRLPPFVQSYLMVQGGNFDHADRLFHSIHEAWDSASRRNKTDVRELTPEFFCLPEFLTNMNDYDFGRRQSNGVKVDDVILPPWAKGDPKIFIAKHREALESPYVSENIHHWIDLIFGFKQLGEAAVENLNVFHHLSYSGASDLDRITDANERAITAGVIHNFGQTPHQVFTKAHPARETVRCPIRRLDTSVFSLRCLANPLFESRERVASLIYSPKLDRLHFASPFRINFPPWDKFLEWGYADNSIRFFHHDNRKLAGLFENLHIGQISCATFADSKTLITAGEDCVISVHGIKTSPGKPVELVPKSSLFGHKTPVTTIAASKEFSTFVTVSTDGQALLWDLNQLAFIRKLPLVRPVEDAKINNVTGDILLCSGPNVLLYTLNGTLILDMKVCLDQDDYVHSCAFYEGAANEWLEDQLIFTGHRKGRVSIWRKSIMGGKWALELLRRLEHIDRNSEKGENVEAGITCISPMPTCVYTGDEDGRVYEWNFGGKER